MLGVHDVNWEDLITWANIVNNVLPICAALFVVKRWMFDKLNANNDTLNKKLDDIHQELQTDIKETRANMVKVEERMDRNQAEANKRFDDNQAEANRRFDEANKRMDRNQAEANKRFDDNQAQANRRFDEANKRFDDSSRRFDKMYEILMQKHTQQS